MENHRTAELPWLPALVDVHPYPRLVPHLARNGFAHCLAHDRCEEDAAWGEDAVQLEKPAGPVRVDMREHGERVHEVELLGFERKWGHMAVHDERNGRAQVLGVPRDARQ